VQPVLTQNPVDNRPGSSPIIMMIYKTSHKLSNNLLRFILPSLRATTLFPSKEENKSFLIIDCIPV